MDFEIVFKLLFFFGGGMGRLCEVCGVVSGMFMVVGMKYGYSDLNDSLFKVEYYKRI